MQLHQEMVLEAPDDDGGELPALLGWRNRRQRLRHRVRQGEELKKEKKRLFKQLIKNVMKCNIDSIPVRNPAGSDLAGTSRRIAQATAD